VDLPRDVAAVIEVQDLFSFGEDSIVRMVEGGAQRPAIPLTGPALVAMPPTVNPGYIIGPISGFSGTLFAASPNRDDIGLYQAYIEANNIGDTIFSMSFGRQEYSYGNEFLLGDNDFYGGASLDGIKGWWDFDNGSSLELFWSKVDEQNTGWMSVPLFFAADFTDEDTDLYGAYFEWPEVRASLVGFDLYAIGMKSNVDYGSSGSTFFESFWLGGRVYRAPEWGWHFNAEGVYQFGDIDTNAGLGFNDISGWAFEGSLGYTWDVVGNPDLHIGYTFASGDGDTDTDYEVFFPPLQEVHPRLGFADLFMASNIQAIQIGYAGSWENLSWGIELYHFELEEGMDFDGDGYGDDELGNEIDLWFNYQYTRHLSVQLAYALVLIDDAIEDQVYPASQDDAQRFYANLVLRY
jgi:hypothetical protein